ncbi:hypothetical protein [Actinoplanes sp. NPDC089786]|uniref:hypothetical protein n=1 Tax=Actinoplanes sp. NPDC089786 TaxID=3155185 RepID=UPI003424CBC3
MAAGLDLSIHLTGRWTAAVVTAGGRTWPVTFDGQTRIPAGVHIAPDTGAVLPAAAGLAAGAADPGNYLPDPLAALRTSADTEPGPAAAVSAVLAHVANTAATQGGAPIDTLTLTTPYPWGPKSRQRLTLAATAAGLPAPAIVTAAAAAVGAVAVAGQAPRFVLVCSVADDFPALTVLDTANQYTELAATVVRHPDAPGIQETIAELVRQRSDPATPAADGTDWRTAAEINRAREALTGEVRAAVLLPEQTAPVVIDLDDLGKAVRPHLDRLPAAVTDVLADADIDLADITATVLVATDATASLAHAALGGAGLPTAVLLSQPVQLAAGAAQLTAHAHPPTAVTAASTHLPRTKLTLTNLAGIAVFSVASAVLLIQTLRTADINTIFSEVRGVRLPIENLGLAAALAATAAITAAQLAPTTWLSPQGLADPPSTGVLLRRSYLAAAGCGLAIAGLWGIAAGVVLDFQDPAYLRWTLTAAAPIAICAMIIAAVSPRIPADRLTTWLPRMRPPIWPIALAAAGTFLVRWAYTTTVVRSEFPFLYGIAAIGAAALGAATAATVTRQRWAQVTTGLILTPGYALLVTVHTIRYLTITYIAALIWWHLTATLRTLRDATPETFRLSRLIGKP